MKKTLSFLLAFLMLLSVAAFASADESDKLQGCCHRGGWEEAGLEPREGGEF